MPRARHRPGGFTLIELMIVVSILGIIASIAITSLGGYLRRARTAEAAQNLNALYKSAAALYMSERASRGISSTVVTNCVAEPTALTPSDPTGDKQRFTPVDGFLQLNFRIADYVYFGYGLASTGAAGSITCLASPGSGSIYTFFANGDLDGDGRRSTFEMAVSSDEANQLSHSRGLYIVAEPE